MEKDKPTIARSFAPQRKGLPREQLSKVLVGLVGVVATLLVLWALRMTMWVSMPTVAAFFVALAVWPVSQWMHLHLPRWLGWLGHLAAIFVLFAVLSAFVLGLWYAAGQVASGWHRYDDSFQSLWNEAAALMDGVWNGARPETDGGSSITGQIRPLEYIGGFAMSIVQSIWNILAVLVLIIFLVLLMLLEAGVWRAKLSDLTDDRGFSVYGQVISDVAIAFRRYLLVRTVVGALTAAAYAVWLWLWQVDFVIVWALLAFLFNFVPTIGSLLAGGLAVIFTLLQKDPGTAAIVGLGLLAIEQVFGNYVDPLLQGRILSLSPVMLLFSLLAWGWVWGIPGMLLAAPISVLLVMVTARIPHLSAIALALSGEKSREDLRRGLGADE